MKPDVMINGVSMLSLGWLRESISFPTPQSQKETLVVPGRNSPIRFSKALGRVAFQPRTFEITLTMLGDRVDYDRMVEETVNAFAGQLARVMTTEEPDLYAVGTLEVATNYYPLIGKGTLIFSCTDGDAYRYHVDQTSITITGGGTVSLANDYMPVVPVITTTKETALSWRIGSDTFRKTVSAGTWEIPELELQSGNNMVTLTGDGTTTFVYREGRL